MSDLLQLFLVPFRSHEGLGTPFHLFVSRYTINKARIILPALYSTLTRMNVYCNL